MQNHCASVINAERSFWLRWVGATTIGSILGGAASGAVVLSGEIRFTYLNSSLMAVIVMSMVEAVAFAARGVAVGVAQAMVLRQSVVQSGWWVVATTAGWTVAGGLSGVLAGAFGGRLTQVGPDAGSLGIVVTALGSIAAVLVVPGLFQ